MDTTKIPEWVMCNLRERLKKDKTEEEFLAKVRSLEPKELLDHYLGWEGIHGYTTDIIMAWEALNEAARSLPEKEGRGE